MRYILLALLFAGLNFLYLIIPEKEIIAGVNITSIGWADWKHFTFQFAGMLGYIVLASAILFSLKRSVHWSVILLCIEVLMVNLWYAFKSILPDDFLIRDAATVVFVIVTSIIIFAAFIRYRKKPTSSEKLEALTAEHKKALHVLRSMEREHLPEVFARMHTIYEASSLLSPRNTARIRDIIEEEIKEGNKAVTRAVNSVKL